jgi:hypothetical protein
MIISGHIPFNENGRSSYLYVIPQVPFYPCLLQNLSPIYGILRDLTLTLTNLYPFWFSLRSTESTTPRSARLDINEHSLIFLPLVYYIIGFVIVNVLPMIGSSSSTFVPGGTIPSLSNFKNNLP